MINVLMTTYVAIGAGLAVRSIAKKYWGVAMQRELSDQYESAARTARSIHSDSVERDRANEMMKSISARLGEATSWRARYEADPFTVIPLSAFGPFDDSFITFLSLILHAVLTMFWPMVVLYGLAKLVLRRLNAAIEASVRSSVKNELTTMDRDNDEPVTTGKYR
jgi:hypothetical protein